LTNWRVRQSDSKNAFSNGLVLQSRRTGILELKILLLIKGPALEGIGSLLPVCAASTSEAIRKDTGIVSWLHWPDLVTIDGKAVAKTTVHAPGPVQGSRPRETRARVGIFVNCFAPTLPKLSSAIPTSSIQAALGVEIDVDLLRDKVIRAFDWYFDEWERGMHQKLAGRIAPTIPWLGREVEVKLRRGGLLRGKADRIDESGSLLIKERGRRSRILFAPPDLVEYVRTARDDGTPHLGLHSLSASHGRVP